MRITADSIVVATGGHYSAEVGNEAVIAGIARGQYYGLNPVAARIWQLIQLPTPARDLQERLSSEYEITPEQCSLDLFALLESLRDEGLIEVRNVE